MYKNLEDLTLKHLKFIKLINFIISSGFMYKILQDLAKDYKQDLNNILGILVYSSYIP